MAKSNSTGSIGSLRALPSATRVIDIGQFIEEHKKRLEAKYEIKKPKTIDYDRFPVKYQTQSYGRNAVDVHNRINLINKLSYKQSYAGRDFYLPEISYNQAKKYSLN